MAKKTSEKKTRLSQYTAILKDKGVEFKNSLIYGFRFNTIGESNAFHFALMNSGAKYLLYDGANEKVKIMTIEDVDKIKEIAAEFNAVEYKPTILNDYE